MFAIIETGGKQYRVKKNDVVRVEKLDAKEGKTITLDRVLAMENSDGTAKIGTPLLKGASVKAKVLAQIREEKIHVLKFRRRKNSKNMRGHRQSITVLKVTELSEKAQEKKA